MMAGMSDDAAEALGVERLSRRKVVVFMGQRRLMRRLARTGGPDSIEAAAAALLDEIIDTRTLTRAHLDRLNDLGHRLRQRREEARS